jgi:hypothetical protein
MNNITPLTLQQVFDNAVTVAKTGKRSNGQLSCRYRSDSGCKCFIGESMPDELYSFLFETMDARGLMLFAEMRELFGNIDPDLLNEIQKIHDKNSSPKANNLLDIKAVHSQLGEFAKENNLKFDWPAP